MKTKLEQKFITRMEWQKYVDEHLMCIIDEEKGNRLTAAAISSLDGSVLAQSPAFPQLQQEELNDIKKELGESGSLDLTGFSVGGKKYVVIQGEPGEVINGRKGHSGICIKKSFDQVLVFGIYDDGVFPQQCNIIIDKCVKLMEAENQG